MAQTPRLPGRNSFFIHPTAADGRLLLLT
ncbi:unnamed protein product [Chondrus crispus]|uniref:Uncharacterized protein n=1 Tax=Chondrus crispus TaxID=2769 RepID=R7Q9F1_CHOCR|nr:unnamed protein product [Chondrus crispus]CDF33991.1 unnamed protein product [Chondrus crispus]|eukprot:XP_005713810.1 unnamed protein product [Chondrus crispus]